MELHADLGRRCTGRVGVDMTGNDRNDRHAYYDERRPGIHLLIALNDPSARRPTTHQP